MPRILSTNAVPNSGEVVAVQQEIDRLKSEIARAKSRLQELEEDLRLHEAVFSPLRQIPVEVLGEIFTLALPDGVLQNRDRQHLVQLCLVCHAWRDAALSARWLWNRVGVKFDRTLSEKIVVWLSRSGNLPKSLAIDTEGQCGGGMDCAELGSDCRSRNANLAKLLTDGPILDHLHLEYRGSKCFRNLVEALSTLSATSKPQSRTWDCLRSLTLSFHSEWNEPEVASKSTILHIPSGITSLDLRLPASYKLHKDTSNISLNIPSEVLQRLTSLAFTSDWGGNQGLRLLKHCHNVETLTLDIYSFFPFGDPDAFPLPSFPIRLSTFPTCRPCVCGDLYPMLLAFSVFSVPRTSSPLMFGLQIAALGIRQDANYFPRHFYSPGANAPCVNYASATGGPRTRKNVQT
jgi:hypothetical protein